MWELHDAATSRVGYARDNFPPPKYQMIASPLRGPIPRHPYEHKPHAALTLAGVRSLASHAIRYNIEARVSRQSVESATSARSDVSTLKNLSFVRVLSPSF